MKKLLSALVLLNTLGFGVAQAHAADKELLSQDEFAKHARSAEEMGERVKRLNAYQKKIDQLNNNNSTQWQQRGPAVQIPELDANAAGAALALLIGGTFVLIERKKRVAV
jgi:hypothetical protein